MNHSKIWYKAVSLLNSITLVFQLIYPVLITFASTVRASTEETLNFEFNQSLNSFDVEYSTDQKIKYSLSYLYSDNILETVVGEVEGIQGNKSIKAGTCSAGGTCVDHLVKRGIFKWQGQSNVVAEAFIIADSQKQTITKYSQEKIDLIQEEQNWLTDQSAGLPGFDANLIEKSCSTQTPTKSTILDAWVKIADGIYQTKEKVSLDVNYIFPDNDKVALNFTCLPKDESLRTTLKIEQVKTSDLKLPQNSEAVYQYAYDITTGMIDRTFSYDLKLPKLENSEAKISYVEKTLDEAKSALIDSTELKLVSEDNLIQESDSVKATAIDHFTIFVVYMYDGNGQIVINPDKPDSDHKITICHDNNGSKDYVENTVDDNSILKSSGHDGHELDIIPPFDYGICPILDSDYKSQDSSLPCTRKINGHHKYANFSSTHKYDGKNWNLQNQRILENDCKSTGSITIKKTTNPSTNDKYFDFTGTLGSFSLKHNGSKKFSNKPEGSYTISESPKTGWKLKDIQCTGTNLTNITKDIAAGLVTIDLQVAENVSCTFQNEKLSSIHGYKWNDVNGNQERDFICTNWFIFCFDGYYEPKLSNWNISLTNLDDNTSLNTLTDSDGDYRFNNLISGRYEVCETPQNGWINSTSICKTIDLDPGKDKEINFGNKTLPKGTLVVKKVIIGSDDLPSEFSFIVDGNPPQNFEADGTNDLLLDAGTYTVTEPAVTGYTTTLNNCTNVVVTSNSSTTCTITNTKNSTLIVHNFMDDNQDGIFDAGELPPASANWESSIYQGENCQGSSLFEKYSSTIDGNAIYAGLTPGKYSVFEQVINPAYIMTPSKTLNVCRNVELMPGSSVTIDIGKFALGSVSGFKYEDKNINHEYDENEPKLSGWTIFIDKNDNQTLDQDELSTSTAADGSYNFSSLLDTGNYAVCEVNQAGWQQSDPASGCKSFSINRSGHSVVDVNIGNSRSPLKLNLVKIVCDDEADLPNWINQSHIIDANTASEFLETKSGRCRQVNDWEFQYAPSGSGYFGDFQTNTSKLDSPWITVESGLTEIQDLDPLNGRIELREVLPDNSYLPFAGGNDPSIPSAEFHCSGDAAYFDNWEWITSPEYGKTYHCIAFNAPNFGKVNVSKFEDLNSNGTYDQGEKLLSGWGINLNTNKQITDETGLVSFTVKPGEYQLSEDLKNGWQQTGIYCNNQGDGEKITKSGEAYGHHGYCEGWNGCHDAATCALWACEVNGYSELVSYGDQKPCTQFNNCHLFNYRGSVQYNWGNWCNVMGVTDIVCSNKLMSNMSRKVSENSSNNHNLTVTAGDTTNCFIGNKYIVPTLTVSKFNNSWPKLQSPGDYVKYTILVTAAQNKVESVRVVDLLPQGIKYRNSTFQAISNIHGVLSIPEPVYSAKAVWYLPDMEPQETITLSYIGDISSSAEPGIYKDIAYAFGSYNGGNTVKAQALATDQSEDPGKLSEIYVGTKVQINKNNQDGKEVSIVEKRTGQVLGATTELPATGNEQAWTILGISSIILGVTFRLIPHRTRRQDE